MVIFQGSIFASSNNPARYRPVNDQQHDSAQRGDQYGSQRDATGYGATEQTTDDKLSDERTYYADNYGDEDTAGIRTGHCPLREDASHQTNHYQGHDAYKLPTPPFSEASSTLKDNRKCQAVTPVPVRFASYTP